MPLDSQPVSLQLTHFSAIAPMPGYEGGKIVAHVSSDLDKVVDARSGSANFASGGAQGDEDGWLVGEDEGLGALKGVLDEASIL